MIWAALSLGLFSSLHCMLMCGPILLALPGGQKSLEQIILGRLAYHSGRILSYSMLGAILGLLGQGASLAGFQEGLSVSLGVLVLLGLLGGIHFESLLWRIPLLDKMLLSIRKQMGRLLGADRPKHFFNLGLLNGFLPCGMVYLAIAGALASPNYTGSIAFMALFGLGTLATMLPLSLFSAYLKKWRFSYAKPILRGFTFLFGCWLILKGLAIDIPYLSPVLAFLPSESGLCH